MPRLALALALLPVLACGGATGGGDEDAGASAVDSGVVADARIFIDAEPAQRGCSEDLHDVLDGEGNVLQTCPLDQGCSEGTCIPACEAAANSGGNVGCDFFVTTPHFYTAIAPPCFATFVTNNWGTPTNISIERGGQTYPASSFGRIADGSQPEANWATVPDTGLPADEVAVLFLSHDPSSANGTPLTCPVPPAIVAAGGSAAGFGNNNPKNTVGQAWHIQTDVPVSLYDILPYGGASSFLPSAQLLMPSSALGDNFVVSLPKTSSSGTPWMQVLAVEDNTTVSISPNINFPAGTVASAPMGVNTDYVVNAGEYIQWQFGIDGNASGSIVSSDKPVSVIGGDTYICYDSATSIGGGCDSAHQTVPPISAMGMEYVAAPFKSRRADGESIEYRITGVVDDTTLTYEPAVPGAPTTIARGQVIDFEATTAFTVTSQDEDHPIHLGQMMSGSLVDSPLVNGLGDEEYVNVLPPAQFLRRYVFFSDPSYPYTSLALTRVANDSGEFADVTVDCLGVVSGWEPADESGRFEVATVDLVVAGAGVDGCTNGSQAAYSDQPFGVTVWGLDQYASYAYPAGGNARTINDVVIIID